MSENDAADASADGDDAPAKKSKKPLIIGLVLLLLAGGGGFFATFSNMLTLPGFGSAEESAEKKEETTRNEELSGVAYVSLDEIVVPLSPRARAKFLAFKASIEVNQADVAAFEALRPRILDIFNTYLRAVEESDLEDASATTRLRAQLLRRIRVVSAPAEPRDLLISSFILK